MRLRARAVASAATLCLLLASGTALGDVHAGLKPAGAFASIALRIDTSSSYLVDFDVLREPSPVAGSVELISAVWKCRDACVEVAEQTDALPERSLRFARDGSISTLRTTWQGLPLLILWTPSRVRSAGELVVTTSADGMHKQVWLRDVVNNDDRDYVKIGRHGCRGVDGQTYTADAGSAQDYLPGPSGAPAVSSVRRALLSTGGRCYNPQR